MKIIQKNIADLKPDPRNPRVIPQTAIDATAASIAKFGWQHPLVIQPDGTLIAGHTRYHAAKKLGKQTAPCTITDLTGKDLQHFAITDNRTAEFADWNIRLLTQAVTALDEAAIGFGEHELRYFATEAANQNAPASTEQQTASRPGGDLVPLTIFLPKPRLRQIKAEIDAILARYTIGHTDK